MARVAWRQVITVVNLVGMSLWQVYCGQKLLELALEVYMLWFHVFVEKVTGRRVEGMADGAEDGAEDGADDGSDD